MTRPPLLTLISWLLMLEALVCAACGLALTWLSGCCGATSEDSGYALAGLVLAAPTAFAGLLVMLGGTTRWAPMVFAAVLPIGLAVSSVWSLDLAGAVVPAVLAWVGVVVSLDGDAARAWMHPHSVRR